MAKYVCILANLLALQFPTISLCPDTHTSIKITFQLLISQKNPQNSSTRPDIETTIVADLIDNLAARVNQEIFKEIALLNMKKKKFRPCSLDLRF